MGMVFTHTVLPSTIWAMFFTLISFYNGGVKAQQRLVKDVSVKGHYGPEVFTTRKPFRECPLPCFCQMKRAFCDESDLVQLPKGMPWDVQYLNAKDNKIRRLKVNRMAHMSELQQINLRRNYIYVIESKTFRNMGELKALTLRDNRLRHMPPDVFKGLYSLEQLSLRNNRLRDIEHIFDGLIRLNLLSLGENRIKRITDDTFKSNLRLRVLDLHNNSISFIHKDAFKSLPFLKFLILRDNPLKYVDLDFKLNYHLELMDFTNCKLKQVVQGLPLSIRDLRMSENSITELRDHDFKKTKKIRFLMLSENKIRHIQNNTFAKLWMLYDLHLSNNTIREIPQKLPRSMHGFYAINNSIHKVPDDLFEHNRNLEFLYLNHNRIKRVGQNAFVKLPKLQALDLSSNAIAHLKPLAFQNSHLLELLDLSNNPIQEAEHNCFEGLQNLHILQMSSVRGSSHVKPSIFKDTQNLLFLDLSNSSQLARHLAETPLILNYIQTVEDLNLMEDNLYGLPPDFPNRLPQLKTIKLIGNPWHCDRSIFWLTMWLQNQSVEFFHQEKMVCASPPEMKGRFIGGLKYDELPTVAPPNMDYVPEIEILDIPFTHGKNITIYIGGGAFKFRNHSVKMDDSSNRRSSGRRKTQSTTSTTTMTTTQVPPPRPTEANYLPTTSLPLPDISKEELLKKYTKPIKTFQANSAVPSKKGAQSSTSGKRRPNLEALRGFRVKQINGVLPVKDDPKSATQMAATVKHVAKQRLPWGGVKMRHGDKEHDNYNKDSNRNPKVHSLSPEGSSGSPEGSSDSPGGASGFAADETMGSSSGDQL